MKNSPTDRMKDPYYAGLLLHIENIICITDDSAKGAGVVLTDSQVRSALIKVRKLIGGGEPDISETTDRDRILHRLIMSLYHAPSVLMEKRKLSDIVDWAKAMETVEDSIRTRKSDVPGSRDYLDYVHHFMAQVHKAK